MEDKILVTRSSMPELNEYIAEIQDLWQTHWLTNMGVKHEQLEADLARYLQLPADNLTLFVNGHQALECILEAMRLGEQRTPSGEPRNEVITTPFTFASTTHALARKGLKPVFADIRPDDFTLDAEKIEALITDRTCAILPVHVYGNLCDVDAIKGIAKKHDLKVIYDAAHAFAVTRDGKSSALFGDASMFSFHATKVFNTIEGGAVCFADPELKTLLNNWKNFGITGPENVEFVGGNAKMNEFCAAMGICNLRHLDEEIEKRKAVVERYRSHLEGIPGIQLNAVQEGVKSNYAYFPVLFDADVLGFDRDAVFEELEQNGIGARKYFYPLTSTYECYKGWFDVRQTPVALRVSTQVLTLPLYADLSIADVDRICNVILNMISENK